MTKQPFFTIFGRLEAWSAGEAPTKDSRIIVQGRFPSHEFLVITSASPSDVGRLLAHRFSRSQTSEASSSRPELRSTAKALNFCFTVGAPDLGRWLSPFVEGSVNPSAAGSNVRARVKMPIFWRFAFLGFLATVVFTESVALQARETLLAVSMLLAFLVVVAMVRHRGIARAKQLLVLTLPGPSA